MIKFNLQRLLDLRERKEQAIATQLTNARTAAQAATDARDAIAEARRSGEAQIAQASRSTPTIGEMHALGLVLERLDHRLLDATNAVDAAEALVVKVREQLTAASQDRQVLTRLKDKHVDAQRAAESAKDRTVMDAIALTRFSRRDGDKKGGSA